MAGVGFSAKDAGRIADAVRYYEGNRSVMPRAGSARAGASEGQFARCLSATPDALGHYPGVATAYAADSGLWLDWGEVSLRDPGGAALSAGTTYAVRPAGVAPTGLDLYLVSGSGGSGGGGAACRVVFPAQVCDNHFCQSITQAPPLWAGFYSPQPMYLDLTTGAPGDGPAGFPWPPPDYELPVTGANGLGPSFLRGFDTGGFYDPNNAPGTPPFVTVPQSGTYLSGIEMLSSCVQTYGTVTAVLVTVPSLSRVPGGVPVPSYTIDSPAISYFVTGGSLGSLFSTNPVSILVPRRYNAGDRVALYFTASNLYSIAASLDGPFPQSMILCFAFSLTKIG